MWSTKLYFKDSNILIVAIKPQLKRINCPIDMCVSVDRCEQKISKKQAIIEWGGSYTYTKKGNNGMVIFKNNFHRKETSYLWKNVLFLDNSSFYYKNWTY